MSRNEKNNLGYILGVISIIVLSASKLSFENTSAIAASAGTIIGTAIIPLALSGIISIFKENSFGLIFGIVSVLMLSTLFV